MKNYIENELKQKKKILKNYKTSRLIQLLMLAL